MLTSKSSIFVSQAKEILVRAKEANKSSQTQAIFTVEAEFESIYNNRGVRSTPGKVTSANELLKATKEFQESVRNPKEHSPYFRDLTHKVYKLNILKGGLLFSTFSLVEYARVNFQDIDDYQNGGLSFLNLDFQVLQYEVKKSQQVCIDKEVEKKTKKLKMKSVLEECLKSPSRLFIMAFLGQDSRFTSSNVDILQVSSSLTPR
jgi:hypothetical protein